MKGPEAYIYVLKKKDEDVFYIGSTGWANRQFGGRAERLAGYEFWSRVRIDPRKRSRMEGRMIRQARDAGWILINQNDPPEHGPDDRVTTSWLIQAMKRNDWGSIRVWLDRALSLFGRN